MYFIYSSLTSDSVCVGGGGRTNDTLPPTFERGSEKIIMLNCQLENIPNSIVETEFINAAKS